MKYQSFSKFQKVVPFLIILLIHESIFYSGHNNPATRNKQPKVSLFENQTF